MQRRASLSLDVFPRYKLYFARFNLVQAAHNLPLLCSVHILINSGVQT